MSKKVKLRGRTVIWKLLLLAIGATAATWVRVTIEPCHGICTLAHGWPWPWYDVAFRGDVFYPWMLLADFVVVLAVIFLMLGTLAFFYYPKARKDPKQLIKAIFNGKRSPEMWWLAFILVLIGIGVLGALPKA